MTKSKQPKSPKLLGEIIVSIISVISVFCSIYAVFVSKEGNRISKNAIKTSEYQFLRLNRPYILVKPKKIDDTNDYIKISRDGNKIRCEVAYVVTNVGTAPAAYIRYPQSIIAEPNIPVVELHLPSQLPLAPNDKYEMGYIIESSCKTEKDAQYQVAKFQDPNWQGMIVGIPVNYDNGLDFRQMYVTNVRIKFRVKEAYILKEEFETFDKVIKSGKVQIQNEK